MPVQDYIAGNARRTYPFLSKGDYGALGWSDAWFSDFGIYMKPRSRYNRSYDGDIVLRSITYAGGGAIATLAIGPEFWDAAMVTVNVVTYLTIPQTFRFNNGDCFGFITVYRPVDAFPAAPDAIYAGSPQAVFLPTRVVNLASHRLGPAYLMNSYGVSILSDGTTDPNTGTLTPSEAIPAGKLVFADGRNTFSVSRGNRVTVQIGTDPAVGSGFENGCESIAVRTGDHTEPVPCNQLISSINGVGGDPNGAMYIEGGPGVQVTTEAPNVVVISFDKRLLVDPDGA